MVENSFPLKWGSRTYVMGILNITSDSFSGDGLIRNGYSEETIIEQARSFIKAGVDILDIGGESTRPGADTIYEDMEMERVLPVIRAIRRDNPDILLSIDTYKSRVAREAIAAGADWINDVWGLKGDPRMASTAADLKVPIILMHNRSKPADVQLQQNLGGRYIGVEYTNLIEDIKTELMDCVSIGLEAGIEREKIVLDPGIGFGKTVEQNLEIINRLNEIRTLGFPIVLGTSRKSFIGYTLTLPPDARLEGTAATVAIGISKGADIVRVHDVPEMVRVARMSDAIVRR